MSRISSITLTLLLSLSASSNMGALADKSPEQKGVTVDAKVMASPDLTYEALRQLRDDDPTGSKVLSTSENESVVEEIFDDLPVIGKATCVYRETYEPQKKISFKMIRSDKMKAFEGEWTLEPIDNGTHTHVKLHSYVDIGLKVPFAEQITKMTSAGELKQQIADLKKSAESKQQKVASRNANQSL